MLRNKRIEEYLNTKIGTKYKAFTAFCEKHKVQLLTAFAVVLVLAVGTAGVFNFCTAYEYSYNGKTLSLVKSKTDVLEITDLVQDALTEEKNLDVVVDAQNDIEFKRVPALGNVKIDTSEDVLKRLTYMGDLNVKAYGIYIDGKKVGAVETKEIAAEVMQDIKDKYASGRDGAEIEEAVFIEKVDVKLSNTDLQDLLSEKEMVERLCTSGEKESIHTVIAGETLEEIAKLYSMKEETIIEDNPTINTEKLDAGSNIVIKQNAPVLTVRITEVVTYDEKVKFEVKKVKDKEIYEGYSEVKQKGKNGKNEVTARIVSVNGEEIEHNRLKETVISKPVTKVIHIGTKERPPTVGSGKYIWPLESQYYTVTSEFGARWGRNHNGIDLGCPTGSPVRAADGGTVTQAGYAGSFGILVVIDHQNGMETYYAHNSSLEVSVGDKVFQGQKIANSGNTGRSTGPHCHFEIRVNGSPINPRNYLP
jgi:murein DD-endopeptidase MepM/ murein hydrolase activator NlpD